MSLFILSQLLVGLSFATGVFAWQQPTRKGILLGMGACACLNALHFVCLQQWTAAAVVAVTAVRILTSAYVQSKWVMWLFLIMVLVAGFSQYQAPISLLVIVGTLIGTWGSFRPNPLHMRLAMMATSASWVVHNIVIFTPVGAVMEGCFVISNAIGYWRMRKQMANCCA